MLQILLHVVPIIQGGPEFELETNSGTRKFFELKLVDLRSFDKKSTIIWNVLEPNLDRRFGTRFDHPYYQLMVFHFRSKYLSKPYFYMLSLFNKKCNFLL